LGALPQGGTSPPVARQGRKSGLTPIPPSYQSSWPQSYIIPLLRRRTDGRHLQGFGRTPASSSTRSDMSVASV